MKTKTKEKPIELIDLFVIGENRSYRFGVAQIGKPGGRWIGFAVEIGLNARAAEAFRQAGLAVEPPMLFLLPEVSEGVELGLRDRNRAIFLTGAIAQDVESSYGGVNTWFVPLELRGDPAKLRCPVCEHIGCVCEF